MIKKVLSFLVVRPLWWLCKLVLKITAILVLVILAILATSNIWIPRALKSVVYRNSGFPTTIEKSKGTLFEGRVDLRDLQIKNPYPMFQHNEFININKVVADVDMSTILSRNICFEEVILDLESITLVKNSDGQSNVSYFVENFKKKFGTNDNNTSNKKQKSKNKNSDTQSSRSIAMQKLYLRIGTVNVINEADGTSQTYTINYSKTFSDVTNFKLVTAQLAVDLSKYGISMLFDSVLSAIPGMPDIAVDGIIKAKNISVEKIGDVSSKISEKAGKAGKTLKKGISSGLKKLFDKHDAK